MKACRWAGAVLLLAVWGLAGCRGPGPDGRVWRVQGHLVTVYTLPRTLHRGPARVGVRVQDRDYRILDAAQARFTWGPADGDRSTVEMQPGPGRDLRARIELPRSGEYTWDLAVVLPQGVTLTVHDRFRIRDR